MADDPSDVVLIIGAGSTGLALAQGLKKSNVPCIVFERDESLTARSRDWNMGLHWGAPLLKSLVPPEVWTRIQTVQVDPNEPTPEVDALRFINAETGEEFGRAPSNNFYRLVRSKLRVLLSEGIDIRYNKKLSNLVYSDDGMQVDAQFEDGTNYPGRIVVGADGARSVVRRLTLKNTDYSLPRRIPYAATWVQARYTREQALHLRSFHPLYLGGVHSAGHVTFFGAHDASDATAPESWLFFFYISYPLAIDGQDAMAKWTQAEQMAHVKALAAKCSDPWKSAFEWLPDDHPLWIIGMADWDPATPEHAWDNNDGRVTLAGDAAHVMTYQRGQGLNHSLKDATELFTAISKSWDEQVKQDGVITEYETEMKARAGTEVRMSTANTEALHVWDKVVESPLFKSGMSKSS